MQKLFHYTYINGPISKQDLSLNLSLSIPTVSQYLKEFISNGLITKDGTFESTGGRKASAYRCNPSRIYGVGVYITRYYFIITIVQSSR